MTTVLRGDARHLPLADNTVDLIVSSPPYFALRSYQDSVECKRCRELREGYASRNMESWEVKRNLREAWPDYDAHVAAEHKPSHYAGQIGSEPTPAEFVDALLDVTRECMRVLKPSGSLWINLGDKYNSAASGQNGTGATTLNPNRGPKMYNGPRCSTVQAVRAKSLMGIPWRYALACIDQLGLILRAEVIWSKSNGLPESVQDRVRRSHEQWFHMVLHPRYYSAIDEIREPHITPGITLGRRIGGGNWGTVAGGGSSADGSRHTDGNPLGKLPGSVWQIPTEPLKVPAELGIDHFAAFPLEFPLRLIRGWSPPGVCTACGEGRRPTVDVSYAPAARRGGDGSISRNRPIKSDLARPDGETKLNVAKVLDRHTTITGYACACPEPTAPTRPAVVLDPFGGTGTTALAARALGRHGISVDLSADYCRLARWRTTDEGELAKAMRVEKPAKQVDGQMTVFDLLDGEAS